MYAILLFCLQNFCYILFLVIYMRYSKFFVLFLSFILVFSSFSFVFADTETSSFDLPSLDNTISTLYGSEFLTSVTFASRVYRSGSTNVNTYFYAYSTPSYNNIIGSEYPVYLFLLQEANTLSPIFVCDHQFANGEKAIVRYGSCDYGNSRASQYAVLSNTSTFVSDLALTYINPGHYLYTNSANDSNIISYETYFPTYSSINDGLTALRAYLDTPSVDSFGNTKINVAPGNVAFIGVTGGNVGITFNYGDITQYGPGHDSYKLFKNVYHSNIRVGYTQNLPDINSSSFTFDNTYGTALDFTAVRPFDVFGRSMTGHITLYDVGYTYVVIYNPVYNSSGELNPTLRVSAFNCFGVVQYPLTSMYDNGVIVSQGSPTQFYIAGEDNLQADGSVDYVYYDVDYDGSVVTSPAVYVPSGGNTIIEESEESSLGGILENLLNIFKAPISYIKTLIENGSSFFSWLSQLYSWLPAPVVTVLSSAFVVLIVIGVIKFLWK